MKRYLGIDIGSRTIKVALIERDKIIDYKVEDTGIDFLKKSREMLKGYKPYRVVATGYGRNLAKGDYAHGVISEIKAHAMGARHLFPKCRTVLDVGGQDSKVISLEEDGTVKHFELNDRCAAGTGKFLEVMAKTLGFSIEEFGKKALRAKSPTKITNVCTVFTESEVISLLSQGVDPRDIAFGLHQAIVDRLKGMLVRIGVNGDVVFSGGAARNACLRSLLEEALEKKFKVYRCPEIIGAMGCALVAQGIG
jgi:predicted CoA-substrate-specific enzyme activase